MSEDNTKRREIEIAGNITVGELAELLELPVTRLIGELFKNGIAATINQRIDVDTAQIIIDELQLSVVIVAPKEEKKVLKEKESAEEKIDESSGDWRLRPPVVAIMGHVDHGKTTLLDKILGLKVAEGEAGGITQHIASYQAKHKDRLMTFLDTPGHEAFSALRQHGAALTDIAVIVVAADDGVKPQTSEAIRFAKEEGVKLIVAITKIDKPDADLSKVKQDLVNAGLTPEEWGGDTVVVELSAKTGEGVDALLDMIFLVSDVEELKADYSEGARGLVIETHMAKGVGPLVKVLITKGSLSQGDSIVIGSSYGKARILKDWKGEDIKNAGPTTPVQISGLKSLPDFGETLYSAKNDKEARKAAENATQATKSLSMNSEELLRVMSHRNELSVMPVIVKADVAGSLKSVIDSIQLVATGEVEAKVIGSGVGDVTESDLMLASSSRATIYCFHVNAPQEIKRMAQNNGVKIKEYKIIYELIDDVKSNLSDLLEPEIKDTPMGRLLVKGVFRTTDEEVVCGGEVTKGSIQAGYRTKIYRGEEEVADVEITSVQQKNQEVKEVQTGTMCGLKLKVEDGKLKVLEEDRLEVYKREVIEKTL
ncbi:MAG: translation initiation factor IF-2 [Candidatus Nomurabacteria bacterium]|nr:MAG: translation initiation factor IF-2 [Candidatus Nomurabacteria bacterium]HRV75936.1 translation initiation factor IF-2 [Candidatus Saccharimonadales bacterium]